MEESIISSHDFEIAKNKLKKFSKEVAAVKDLKTVNTKGGAFHLFEHKVSGEELNILTGEIQEHIISINKQMVKNIKEFGQVYEALEALDKDYIAAILSSIKAVEKVSNDAKQNTIDIDKTIKVQEQTLKVLRQFKEKLDKYRNLENIDEVWSDCQSFKNEIQTMQKKVFISYIIAGSAVGVSAISLLLQILGII